MRVAVVACVASLSFATVMASVKATNTWKAEGLTPKTYTKVMVLAKIEEPQNKQLIEDELVKAFAKKKITAVASYATMNPEDLATAEAAKAKAEQLGVDAAVVVTVTERGTMAKPPPQVSVGVGVPVHVGMFSVFVGGSVPVGGGAPKMIPIFALKTDFLEKGSPKPIWTGTYSGDMGQGAEDAANDHAGLVIKGLKKAKVIK